MPSKLKFDKSGLIPAIVQDIKTKQVLTLAYMNKTSLKKTIKTGETWFWSRSRKKLWHKGETSGNIQKVKKILYDCDSDTLLVLVKPTGPACHTGKISCFFKSLMAWLLLFTFAAHSAPSSTPALIKKGEGLFKLNCMVCHGEKGTGIRSASPNMNPAPTQFALGYFSGGTNPDNVYRTITTGRTHTSMPNFKQLSPEDRWALTYYVLSLQKFKKKKNP